MKFESKKIYVDWVQEFYNNMQIEDSGSIKTFVREKWITISLVDIADFFDIPVVENPDYPIPANTQINYDDVATTICGAVTAAWPGVLILHGKLTAEYRFLNRFVCHNLEPRGHTFDVSSKERIFALLHWDRKRSQHSSGHLERHDHDFVCEEEFDTSFWSPDLRVSRIQGGSEKEQ